MTEIQAILALLKSKIVWAIIYLLVCAGVCFYFWSENKVLTGKNEQLQATLVAAQTSINEKTQALNDAAAGTQKLLTDEDTLKKLLSTSQDAADKAAQTNYALAKQVLAMKPQGSTVCDKANNVLNSVLTK